MRRLEYLRNEIDLLTKAAAKANGQAETLQELLSAADRISF